MISRATSLTCVLWTHSRVPHIADTFCPAVTHPRDRIKMHLYYRPFRCSHRSATLLSEELYVKQ